MIPCRLFTLIQCKFSGLYTFLYSERWKNYITNYHYSKNSLKSCLRCVKGWLWWELLGDKVWRLLLGNYLLFLEPWIGCSLLFKWFWHLTKLSISKLLSYTTKLTLLSQFVLSWSLLVIFSTHGLTTFSIVKEIKS